MNARTDIHATLQGRRILIVEDEMLLAMDLESLLESNGCDVIASCPNIKRALDAIDRDRPEAALLDMNLAGASSAPVAEALRDAGVPFVVVTGYSNAEGRAEPFRDVPAVQKPYREDILLSTLASVFE